MKTIVSSDGRAISYFPGLRGTRVNIKFPSQFQLCGNRGGRADIRIGGKQRLINIREQWEKEGVKNIRLYERIPVKDGGLKLQEVY